MRTFFYEIGDDSKPIYLADFPLPFKPSRGDQFEFACSMCVANIVYTRFMLESEPAMIVVVERIPFAEELAFNRLIG